MEKRCNDETRVQAILNADAVIDVLQERYGIKDHEIPQILEDLRWLHRHRAGMNRISWTIVLSIVGSIIAGLVLAVWEGIKTLLKG